MNGIIAETSVEKPERWYLTNTSLDVNNILLVMGLGNDGGERGGGPLPGQHLVLNLSNLLLQVPGGGVHGLPDAEKSVLSIGSLIQSGHSLTWGKTAWSLTHLQRRGYLDLEIRNK